MKTSNAPAKKRMIRPPSRAARIAKRRARPFHKRLLLHPLSVMVLLCTGVLMLGTTFPTLADTIEVTASVHAPLPGAPAIITYPHDQDHFSQPTISVIGTCPADSYVELYRQGVFSGVAQCVNNAFQIQTTLYPGANQLQVKVYNITNDEGPASAPITVYYDPPVAPPARPGAPSTGAGAGTGKGSGAAGLVVILGEYQYQARYVGESFTWNLAISGGRPPYLVIIDWGDGNTTRHTSKNGATFAISHAYAAGGTFEPIVRVTDQDGSAAGLQLSAVVKPMIAGAGIIPKNPFDTLLETLRQYLWIVWPIYAIVVLMALSFWLGELEVVRRRTDKRRAHSRSRTPRRHSA